MDSNGHSKISRFLKSFGYAANGVKGVWKTEQNFRFHTAAAILVIIAAVIFSASILEWCIILLLIFGMLSLEIMNTAIEKTVDLITTDIHPLAKKAKDFSAGAVLIFAIGSIIVGSLIFIPKIVMLFR